jgi:hypothetical protein
MVNFSSAFRVVETSKDKIMPLIRSAELYLKVFTTSEGENLRHVDPSNLVAKDLLIRNAPTIIVCIQKKNPADVPVVNNESLDKILAVVAGRHDAFLSWLCEIFVVSF